jgi:hypothetical protein
MVVVKITGGGGGAGHNAPGGQLGAGAEEQPPAARAPVRSAAARLARKAVIWLTVVGRAAKLTGSGQDKQAATRAATPSHGTGLRHTDPNTKSEVTLKERTNSDGLDSH